MHRRRIEKNTRDKKTNAPLPGEFVASLNGRYDNVAKTDCAPEELDRFLRLHNAKNLNVIKNCLLFFAIFLGILLFVGLLNFMN